MQRLVKALPNLALAGLGTIILLRHASLRCVVQLEGVTQPLCLAVQRQPFRRSRPPRPFLSSQISMGLVRPPETKAVGFRDRLLLHLVTVCAVQSQLTVLIQMLAEMHGLLRYLHCNVDIHTFVNEYFDSRTAYKGFWVSRVSSGNI